jgi:hypothetical protein
MTYAFDPKLPRVNRALSKIVRGLYFRETGTRVPDDHGVAAFAEPDTNGLDRATLEPVLRRPRRVVVEGGFEYWFALAADVPTVAIVVMRFFRGVLGLGFVGPRDPQQQLEAG